MVDILLVIVQVALVLALAPMITGIVRKMKAYMQSRRGPPIMQPYYDLVKLMRKGSVVSEDASWVTTVTPYVCVVSMVLAAALIPAFVTESLGFLGDLIVLVYLFAMARFFMALAAMDAGSTFGGMGSSREMLVSSLVEPAMLLSFFSVAILTGTTSLVLVTQRIATSEVYLVVPVLVLAFASFIIVILAENARVPVDNPATHLELTMIHEGMLLEYSGRDLALMEYSSMVKLTLFITIAWSAFMPWGIATELTAAAILVGLVVLVVKLLALALVIAVIESSIAKLRLFRLPNLLTGAFILAFLAVLSYFVL